MGRIRLLAVSLAACAALGAPALLPAGIGLLPNGEFDALFGVGGWFLPEPAVSALSWDPDDADDCLESGSALLANSEPSQDFRVVAATACHPAAPGDLLQLSAHAKFPGGTAASTFALQIAYFDTMSCTGVPLETADGPELTSSATAWTELVWPDRLAPAGAQSMEVRLLLAKDAAAHPLAEVRLDRVLLTRNGALFGDDFSVAETCRWDLAVP